MSIARVAPVPAGLAHAGVMAAIHAAAFAPPEAWSAGAIAAQLALPGVFGLVHEAGGMLLARVAADEAELLTLGVAPDQRRQGVGGALLRAALQRSAQAGARAMFLEVATGNTPARVLYDSAGFAVVGQRRGYYADGQHALVLRCQLSRPAAAAAG